jgi:hypothetical protein
MGLGILCDGSKFDSQTTIDGRRTQCRVLRALVLFADELAQKSRISQERLAISVPDSEVCQRFGFIGISRSQLISPKYNSDAILFGEWGVVPYP